MTLSQNLNLTFSFNGFVDYVKGNILNNFFQYKLSSSDISKLKIEEKIMQAFDQQTIQELYTEISKLFLEEKWIISENYKEQLNPYIDIFIKADQFLEFIEHFHTKNSSILDIKINEIPNDFINLYEIVVGAGVEFLRFSFPYELSDGEENFLSFFATLNERRILKYTDTEITNNIILSIDEGELTLHPMWQKKYIKYIVDYLKNNFTEYKVHLIFTTHSPFLLSDLPKQNIVFLDTYKEDKDDQKSGNCKVLKHDEVLQKKQTFGANIHTLLSDSFFIDDGLMGEFAKGKIENVINFLRDQKIDIKDYQEAENIISIIGEPVLKMRLQKMLDDYKGKQGIETKEDIQKQIDELNLKLRKMQDGQDKPE